MYASSPVLPEGVDLHAGLTLLLQLGNDPYQTMRIATFSMIQGVASGSVFDARNDHFWLKFRCKSTSYMTAVMPATKKGYTIHINIQFSLFLTLFLCILTPVWAAPILVDDFSTAQSGTSFLEDPNVLGGERDVVANGLATFTSAGGTAVMGLSSGNANFVLLDYDGVDNSAGGASFLLGGLDLTDGGTNNAIFLDIPAVTGTVMVTARMAVSLLESIEVTVPVSAAGTLVIPIALFLEDEDVSPESVNRFFVRFNFDVGESLTLDSIFIANDLLFQDGFETP